MHALAVLLSLVKAWTCQGLGSTCYTAVAWAEGFGPDATRGRGSWMWACIYWRCATVGSLFVRQRVKANEHAGLPIVRLQIHTIDRSGHKRWPQTDLSCAPLPSTHNNSNHLTRSTGTAVSPRTGHKQQRRRFPSIQCQRRLTRN